MGKKEFGDETEDAVSLKDIKKFTLPFWILVVSCVVVYGLSYQLPIFTDSYRMCPSF